LLYELCSKCPPLADTHAGSRLRNSTALSMAFCGKAEQTNVSAFLNSGLFLAYVAACGKTSALPPNLTIQWINV